MVQATLHTLDYFAKVWLGYYWNIDNSLPPRDRIIQEVNEEIAVAAIDGILALPYRKDLPSPISIASLSLEQKHPWVTYPLLLGMNIIADQSHGDLISVPDSGLMAALCCAFSHPIDTKHDWREWIIANKPDVAARALGPFWRVLLKNGAKCPDGLYGITGPEPIAGVAGIVALELLGDFPAAQSEAIKSLLSAALYHRDHRKLLDLARATLSETDGMSLENRALWTATAFVLDPVATVEAADALMTEGEDAAWTFFQFSARNLALFPEELKAVRLRLFIDLVTPHFENVPDFIGSRRVGERDVENAARIIRSAISGLASDSSDDTASFLAKLRDDLARASWRDHAAHVAADQARTRREALFAYPTLAQVMRTLENAAPANTADLQALVIEHLVELSHQIRHGSTDTWKSFWNTNRNAKPTEPKVEDPCRDLLLGFLSPYLARHAVMAKPEGHYAEDKRADIDVIFSSFVLPIEVKRQMHPDLWSAAEQQLQRLYMRDPAAGNRGIYLVLWFGSGEHIPAPPPGISRPTTAAELKSALAQMLPINARSNIQVVVIDVAPPNAGLPPKAVARARKTKSRHPPA